VWNSAGDASRRSEAGVFRWGLVFIRRCSSVKQVNFPIWAARIGAMLYIGAVSTYRLVFSFDLVCAALLRSAISG
jgi:hypothetical protein